MAANRANRPVSLTRGAPQFRVWDGRIVTLSNTTLANMTIVNVARSPPMYDVTSIVVDMRTPPSAIDELWGQLLEALRTKPNDFLAAKCSMNYASLSKQNALQVDFCVAHCTNWAKGQHIARRHFVLQTITVRVRGLVLQLLSLAFTLFLLGLPAGAVAQAAHWVLRGAAAADAHGGPPRPRPWPPAAAAARVHGPRHRRADQRRSARRPGPAFVFLKRAICRVGSYGRQLIGIKEQPGPCVGWIVCIGERKGRKKNPTKTTTPLAAAAR